MFMYIKTLLIVGGVLFMLGNVKGEEICSNYKLKFKQNKQAHYLEENDFTLERAIDSLNELNFMIKNEWAGSEWRSAKYNIMRIKGYLFIKILRGRKKEFGAYDDETLREFCLFLANEAFVKEY